ncbi:MULTISPECIES: hypothetical protein [Paracoccaceae]|uniref:Arginine transporter n=1 Tax=Rhodophyticola porphyridii TaxID=1852017 RepID=A0A3L9Y659_9RHOB|nr:MULTISPECIES: hypothetical protein [Paracoccaceae]MBO6602520.1 hypothetical protein [Roseicyclus sp.]MBO6624771.1 hypothetical protein [Roseicyclus sp.]MBO6921491.1 hypothetical protein [Roseicyclus sp.]RMA44221.1 hypothetical protein D9R08_02840 [Rhodophyticola porphyridii]
MKKSVLLLAALMMASAPISTPASANAIERACNQSDRRAANRQLCGCIGVVADMTLSRTDQRQAARFFSDPQRAQDVRMSDRASDEAFWDRYRSFGETAEAMCG